MRHSGKIESYALMKKVKDETIWKLSEDRTVWVRESVSLSKGNAKSGRLVFRKRKSG